VELAAGPLGGVLGWLSYAVASALVGLVLGGLVAGVMHVVPRRGGKGH
jgi:predicted DNA repair protein MutK